MKCARPGCEYEFRKGDKAKIVTYPHLTQSWPGEWEWQYDDWEAYCLTCQNPKRQEGQIEKIKTCIKTENNWIIFE